MVALHSYKNVMKMNYILCMILVLTDVFSVLNPKLCYVERHEGQS